VGPPVSPPVVTERVGPHTGLRTTSLAKQDEIEEFYSKLRETTEQEREYYTIVMGDWNGKIGRNNPGNVSVGKYVIGIRNEAGERILELANTNNLKVANTFLKKRPEKKWTWIAPDKVTKNEIDHLLINDMRIVKNCQVLARFEFDSDHRVCRCQIQVENRIRYRNGRKKKSGKKGN